MGDVWAQAAAQKAMDAACRERDERWSLERRVDELEKGLKNLKIRLGLDDD